MNQHEFINSYGDIVDRRMMSGATDSQRLSFFRDKLEEAESEIERLKGLLYWLCDEDAPPTYAEENWEAKYQEVYDACGYTPPPEKCVVCLQPEPNHSEDCWFPKDE